MKHNLAIIYDLDQTILPANAVPDAIFDPVFEAIKKANKGKVTDARLKKAFSELKNVAIDVVAERYGFSKEMDAAARDAFSMLNYSFELQPYEDYEVIKKIPGIKVLVTSGIVKLQQAKIDALEIEGDFDEVIIDDIYAANRPGKKEIFSRIASTYQLNPGEVWIVGDNPDAEIAAGNELGMVTVLRTDSKETKVEGAPTFTIATFNDLRKLVTESLKIES